MNPIEKVTIFKNRFLQRGFGIYLSQIGGFDKLLTALTDEDMMRMEELNVFFCRSYAPSVITELKNTPSVETLRLIIFENEYLTNSLPEEVVAIILHEIGHAFYPEGDLKQKEFSADDFAISRGYGKHLKQSLESSIINFPHVFANDLNAERVSRIQ
jgi:hypothetical protein